MPFSVGWLVSEISGSFQSSSGRSFIIVKVIFVCPIQLGFFQKIFPERLWDYKCKTRWTLFRVKLVFEFEFEISWSSGPLTLDPETLGLLDFGTSSLLHHLQGYNVQPFLG